MASFRPVRVVAAKVARAFVFLTVLLLVLVGIGIAVVETRWAKDQLRELVIRQANQYLTVTLHIGRLEGSLFRGLELADVSLSRDGHPVIAIDSVSVNYSPRELYQNGTIIRRLVVTRPRVVGARLPDGRWDLGALVKRETRQEDRSGPRRAIEIQQIEVIDATVLLRDPLKFGAANVPTEFTALNASFSFLYVPVRWTLAFDHASWTGRAPDLSVSSLSGSFGRGADGWFFDKLAVQTARSAFTFTGQVMIGDRPTVLNLAVKADRFAFQEWSGVLTGLKNIAVESAFDTTLKGPLTALDTQLTLSGTGGSVKGTLTLNTRVPGWHATGAVDVGRINLARWLNRADRPSDITGHVAFDLDLDLGRRFPRGTYAFDGPHAMYMNYAADDLHAQGRLTASEVLIDRMTARAYSADLAATTGSIGLDSPYPYQFKGSMSGLDLRAVPESVPVPRVESTLSLDYDVVGSFSRPFITGHARFRDSIFLGATIRDGMVGTIDTASTPIRYSGEGDIDAINLNRFGEGLDVAWLQDPRYAGVLSGRFRVEGAGSETATLALTAAGRLRRADLFRGVLSEADVSLEIANGTLHSSFDGRLDGVDPSIAFGDPRLAALLTGSADVRTTVRDLLTRSPLLADYDVRGRLDLDRFIVRGIPIDTATIESTLAGERLTLTTFEVSGPSLAATASGVVAFGRGDPSDLTYDITHADLSALRGILGGSASGLAVTRGKLIGPMAALRAAGDGTLSNVSAYGIRALTATGEYDVTVPSGPGALSPTARITGRATFLELFGQAAQEASGTIALANERAEFSVTMTEAGGRKGDVSGAIQLHLPDQNVDVLSLSVTLGSMPWRLVGSAVPPSVGWDDAGVTVSPMTFATGHEDDQRIDVGGTWRYDGRGALRVTATNAFLEMFQNAQDRPARYGGVFNLDATISGTRSDPTVAATVEINNGRVERVVYEKFAGRVEFARQTFTIDVRLDQAPGTFLTAKGTVPLAVFDRTLPERPLDVAVLSSPIDLGLVQGMTDVVNSATGRIRLDVHVVGTSRDPHFEGTVDVEGAAFQVRATGVSYRNGRAAVRLAVDRITVESFHLEDEEGQPLDVSGSLGTDELRVGDLAIDVTADRFEVVRNEFGRLDIRAMLMLRGRFEAPRLTGDITINGDTLRVDRILERALFQPYATEPTSITTLDAVAALNPWDRMGLDVALHIPRTLRLTGTDVQVSPGTPIGLGDIDLRVGGDLYLYKDPGDPLYVTGSLDQISGTYVFQGRRFEIDEAASSINFMGDLDPQIWVSVTREISGVETRVTITGSLRQPELNLASTPPLDESDILSLIVFNTTPNSLTALQQQELAVRAGTLAAGFIAQPLIQALQTELGLEAFEIEPGTETGEGPRLTIAEEIAPGLVARFSRQFGQEPWNQATLEFYLSRLFRIRATFSDAQSITARSAFRRVERAGIDLLVFFSF